MIKEIKSFSDSNINLLKPNLKTLYKSLKKSLNSLPQPVSVIKIKWEKELLDEKIIHINENIKEKSGENTVNENYLMRIHVLEKILENIRKKWKENWRKNSKNNRKAF